MELIYNTVTQYSTPVTGGSDVLSASAIIEAGNVFDNTINEEAFKNNIGLLAWDMAKNTGAPSDGTTNLRVVISVTRI